MSLFNIKFLLKSFIFAIAISCSAWANNDTECATSVLANALQHNASAIGDDSSEIDVEQWVYQTFAKPDVLQSVLACSEIAATPETETITFTPIIYNFPSGRQITINYQTQPKLLRQRLSVGTKRTLPDDASPEIGENSSGVWTNTDPAWYGIMVVQSGALDDFVGPDKNNTISLEYINDNIDELYPRGMRCTNKTALANDNYTINRAGHAAVDIEDDSNDYYVAGDKSLSWISYTEIALDVVITVATMGGGAVILGATKSVNASRILKNLLGTIRQLSKIDSVKDYIGRTSRLTRLSSDLADLYKGMGRNAASYIDNLKELNVLRGTTGPSDIAAAREYINATESARKGMKLNRQAQSYADSLQNLNNLRSKIDATEFKSVESYLRMDGEISSLTDAIRVLEANDDVKKYRNAMDSFGEINKYRHTLRGARAIKSAQRGNVIARMWRGFRAANTGNSMLSKGAKIARSSMKSGKIRDWLFQSTMRNAGKLAKVEEMGGALYGITSFALDMYDYTSDNDNTYTSGVDFKPLLLLSADDLQGQENVVNYGMWLLWAGDSASAADDDAAYLQAMDFAAKFYQDLSDIQSGTASPCDVDIYVVRPIIHNPGDTDQKLYYLIMNDEPWSTRE